MHFPWYNSALIFWYLSSWFCFCLEESISTLSSSTRHQILLLDSSITFFFFFNTFANPLTNWGQIISPCILCELYAHVIDLWISTLYLLHIGEPTFIYLYSTIRPYASWGKDYVIYMYITYYTYTYTYALLIYLFYICEYLNT